MTKLLEQAFEAVRHLSRAIKTKSLA